MKTTQGSKKQKMKTSNVIRALGIFLLLFSAALSAEAGNVTIRNGSIGIGTANPLDKLHILGSNYPVIRIESTDTKGGDLHLQSIAGDAEIYLEGADLRFWNGTGDIVTFGQNGSVGIGTMAPKSPLDIYKGTTGWAEIGFRNAATGSSSTDGFVVGLDENALSTYVWNNEYAGIYFGTNNSQRMMINADGNVGIGTTGPNFKLDVNGRMSSYGGDGAGLNVFNVGTLESGNYEMMRNIWTGNVFYFQSLAGGTGTARPVSFADGVGHTWLYLEQGGDVGIGTMTPNATFHVNQNFNGLSGVSAVNFSFYDAGIATSGVVFNQKTGGGAFNLISASYNGASGLLVLKQDGSVGIGTSAPESRVQISGGGLCVGSDASCNSDNNAAGVVYSSATAMTVYDVAENYPTKENLSEGDVLVLDPDNAVFVKKSGKAYDTLVVGVFSANPAVLLGGFNGAQFKNETQAAVALTGRVPVKVTNANGPIRIGDLLTTSPAPGTAMRCGAYCGPGTVLGKALENFNESEGKILALMTLQ